MNPQTEYVTLSVGDGTSMRAYVARPQGTPRAGLIVFQEAFGVNAHIRDVTERFAREGYLAISPELFHRTAPGFEGSYSDFPAVMPHLQKLTDAGIAADTRATFDWLQTGSNTKNLSTGAVGYCMGGRCACLAALTVPLGCGISYYGGGIGPSQMFPSLVDRLKDLKAPVLFFWGGKDEHIPAAQVQPVIDALKAAKKSYVNVEFSDADHGFFCDARASYNPAAAAQAWPLTLAFLKTNLTEATKKAQA
jgi:carboxymethylenebutenolidase